MSDDAATNDTPILNEVIEHGKLADPNDMEVESKEAYIRQHNARVVKKPGSVCTWEPCSYVLFGHRGETHEEYHKRKGSC